MYSWCLFPCIVRLLVDLNSNRWLLRWSFVSSSSGITTLGLNNNQCNSSGFVLGDYIVHTQIILASSFMIKFQKSLKSQQTSYSNPFKLRYDFSARKHLLVEFKVLKHFFFSIKSHTISKKWKQPPLNSWHAGSLALFIFVFVHSTNPELMTLDFWVILDFFTLGNRHSLTFVLL